MQKWEYTMIKELPSGFAGGKTDHEKISKAMNELGDEGWELVTTYETNQGYGASREVVLLFKREKK